jgi:AbrB family looped-hinge helix DNA binding protein
MKSVVSPKGQITLPVAVREKLGLVAGTPVHFEIREAGLFVRKGGAGAHPVDRVFGCLKLDKPVDRLLDEMRGARPAAPRRRRPRTAPR